MLARRWAGHAEIIAWDLTDEPPFWIFPEQLLGRRVIHKPYDPAAYGLGEGVSGPYTPTEPVWNPVRDEQLLTQGWLASFILASQAQVAVSFQREQVDGSLAGLGDRSLLLCPAPTTDMTLRGAWLEPVGAEVVARDQFGRPAVLVHTHGQGRVVTVSHPVELLLASQPDDPFADSGAWQLYRGLADLAGAGLPDALEHPDATCGALTGDEGGLLVVTNHTADRISAPVRLPEGAAAPTVVVGEWSGQGEAGIDPHQVLVVIGVAEAS